MNPISTMRVAVAGAAVLGALLVAGAGYYTVRSDGVTLASASSDRVIEGVGAVDADTAAEFRRAIAALRGHDYAAADAIFQRLKTHLPSVAGADFYVAVVEAHFGRAAPAEAAASRYVARAPDDIAGVALLARIQMASDHPERASATLMAAVGAGHLDADALVLLGQAYAAAGDAQRATRTFDWAASLAPDDARHLTQIATARLGLPVEPASAELAPATPSPAERLRGAEAAIYSAVAVGDADRAGAGLDGLRQLPGGAEPAAILTGVVKAARLDYSGARAAFASVPNSPRARLNLARLDVFEGRPDDARKRLGETLQAEPANMAAVQAMIALLLAYNDIQPAIGVVERARAASPGQPLFTIMLADLVLRAGDPTKALAVIDAAPVESASLPAMLIARARMLVATGNPNPARDIYAGLVAREPNNLAARTGLIELLVARNDIDAARAISHAALRAGVGRVAALEAVVRLEARTRGAAAAAAAADQLVTDSTNLPFARSLKGDMFMSVQYFPGAVSAYAEQMRAAPSATLQARLAAALEANGQWDQALTQLRAWVAPHPDDLETLTALASLELSYKRVDDAIIHLNAAIQKQPNNAGALNDLAWAYQLKNDPRARDLARKAYLLAPTAEIADTLGWIMVTSGQANLAVPLLRQAAGAMPGNPTALYHYAVALNAAGFPRDASRVATAALEQPQNFAERRAAGQLLAEASRRP